MRAALHAGLLVAALLALTPAAHGFCIYNDTVDADVHATLLPSKPGFTGKVYREKVEPMNESCCNPNNAECNPDHVADAASITFDAKVTRRARGTEPVDLACGKSAVSSRNPSPRVEATTPLRGSLRFQANPRFNRARPENAANSRYVMRSVSPQNTALGTHACFLRAPA